MTDVAIKPTPRISRFYDPKQFIHRQMDRELFDRELKHFVPDDVYDVHAHWYDLASFLPQADAHLLERPSYVGAEQYAESLSQWMGVKTPKSGLFFPMPVKDMDLQAENRSILAEAKENPDSRVLLMISPKSDPAQTEQQARDRSVAGFKVYHLFAPRNDTQNAPPEEYIPEWAWEIADRHNLCIMLHIVMRRSLAEQANQRYIAEHCRKYPNAKLILAHAARGFCGRHTAEGVEALRGLDNVFFDTSVACEAAAMQAILQTFGPTRLMFGTDFPLSEAHGRAISLGDGYHWLYDTDVIPPIASENTTLVGIESLLAIKQGCQTLHLRDGDIERIFRLNATELLGITKRKSGESGTGQSLYREAKQFIPGGTQLVSKRPEQYAPDKWPAYFREARGCEVIDLDGRVYTDFATSGIGSCLLGYANPAVTSAVLRRVQLGAMSTLNSPEEIELGHLLLGMHPWAEKIRLSRSGGEALSVAVRIARAATKRDLVAFCGYHGWTDWYLAANLGDNSSLNGHLLPGLNPAGVPHALRGTALPFTYNKVEELHRIAKEHGSRLAAVVMEPTRASMPEGTFLQDVRQICDDANAPLIFDEVTTGFRLHRGGVHLKLGVSPDMAVFAKALGNGHPISAIIGKAAVMDAAQDSFISSTYWTEGVGPTAACATLREMQRLDVPGHVGRLGQLVRNGLQEIAKANSVPLVLSGHAGQLYLAVDHPLGDALLTLMTVRFLDHGFLTGAAFYPTMAHDDHAVSRFLRAAEIVFADLADAIRKDDVLKRIDGKVRHTGFRRLN